MKRMKRLLPKSIFAQFGIAFVVVGLLPLLLFTLSTLTRTTEIMENDAIQSVQEILMVMTGDLDRRFSSVTQATRQIYYYDNTTYGQLTQILQLEPNTRALALRDFTRSMLEQADGSVCSIFYSLDENRSYASSQGRLMSFDTAYNWDTSPWVAQAIADPRHVVISKPHTQAYYHAGAQEVVTLARAYLDPDCLPMRDVVRGVIMLDVPTAIIHSTLLAYDWGDTCSIAVLDSEQNLILSDITDPMTAIPAELLSDESESRLLRRGSSCFISRRMTSTGWNIIFCLNMHTITGRLNALRQYVLIMIGVATLCSLILAFIFTRRMSAPIRVLKKEMKKVRQGDLTAHVDVITPDELGEVSTGFNKMVDQLQQYINTTYLAKISQTEAEMNDLKAQIHPHFLYNTLQIIRMTALQNGDTDASEMVEALARQLKYVIGEVRERVELQKELDMARNYISLVEKRYGGIRMEVKIPSALQHCEVVKLCLQPVVENAVQHGLRPKGGGSVSVRAEQNGDDLVITVMDDGVGISAEALQQLNDRLQSGCRFSEKTEDGWRGIGLKNVHDRLTLNYGPAYGLTVKSLPGIGSAV